MHVNLSLFISSVTAQACIQVHHNGSSEPRHAALQLRSIERAMSWTEDACFKIAAAMLVNGQVDERVRRLPTALMHTFNKHPKMRAAQVRDEFAVGDIHPKITLVQLEERQLLHVRATDADGMQSANWHHYAQEQVDIPFDRFM